MSREEILRAKDRSIAHLRGILGDDTETIIAERRYGFISGLLKDVLKKPPPSSNLAYCHQLTGFDHG